MEHHLGERVPHPRSGRDRAAGAGVHAARRPRVRAVGRRRRPRRRQLRAADLVLLQRAQRLLRGDRQVPRRAEDLGAGDARPVRREERAIVEAALPHARPPACRSPRSSPTTTSSAPRCRRCRPCSAAPTRSTPTRSTRRWRCRPREAATLALRTQQIIAHESGVGERRRSARRIVFRREADPGHGGRRAGLLRADRPHGRHGRGDRARVPAEGDRRERLPVPAGRRAPREGDRRRQRLRADRRAADRNPLHRRLGGGDAARQAGAAAQNARQRCGAARARRLRAAAQERRQPDAAAFSTPSGRTRPSGRCATRSATSGASTKKCR